MSFELSNPSGSAEHRARRRQRRSQVIERHSQQEALGVRTELFILQPQFASVHPENSTRILNSAGASEGNDGDDIVESKLSNGIQQALGNYICTENRSTTSLQPFTNDDNGEEPVFAIGKSSSMSRTSLLDPGEKIIEEDNEDDEDRSSSGPFFPRAIQEGDETASNSENDDISSSGRFENQHENIESRNFEEDIEQDDLLSDEESDLESLDEDTYGVLQHIRLPMKEKLLHQDNTGKLMFRSLPGGFVASASGALRFYEPGSLKRALLVETKLHRTLAEAVGGSSPSFQSIDKLVHETTLFSLQTTPDGEALLLNLETHAALLDMINNWLTSWPDRVQRKLERHLATVSAAIIDKKKGAAKANALHSLWELALQPENHGFLLNEENKRSMEVVRAALDVVSSVMPFCGHGENQLRQSTHYMATGFLDALLADPNSRTTLLQNTEFSNLILQSFLVSLKRMPSAQFGAVPAAPILTATIKAIAHLSHEGALHDALLKSKQHTERLLQVAENTETTAVAERTLELLARALSTSVSLAEHHHVADRVCRRAFDSTRRVSIHTRSIVAQSCYFFFRTARHMHGFESSTWESLVSALEKSLTSFDRVVHKSHAAFHDDVTLWRKRQRHIDEVTSSGEDTQSSVTSIARLETQNSRSSQHFSDVDFSEKNDAFSEEDYGFDNDLPELEPVLEGHYLEFKQVMIFNTIMICAALENILGKQHIDLPDHIAEKLLTTLLRILTVITHVKYADVADLEDDEPSLDAENPHSLSKQGKDCTIRQLELLVLTTLVDLIGQRRTAFRAVVKRRAKQVWDFFPIDTLLERHSQAAQEMQAQLLYLLAQQTVVPLKVADDILQRALSSQGADAFTRSTRRHLASVVALACQSGSITLVHYIDFIKTFVNETPELEIRDAIVEEILFCGFPLVVYTARYKFSADLYSYELNAALDLLVDYAAKRSETVLPMLRGLQRLFRAALDKLRPATSPNQNCDHCDEEPFTHAPTPPEPAPSVDRCVRICVRLLLRATKNHARSNTFPKTEASMIEAALYLLWVVSSSPSYEAKSPSLFHMHTVSAVHAAAQLDPEKYRNIPRYSGRVLLALATRNPEIVIEPLFRIAMQQTTMPQHDSPRQQSNVSSSSQGDQDEPQENAKDQEEETLEFKVSKASSVFLRSKTPELVSCGAYFLSTYRLSSIQYAFIRNTGCVDSLMDLVIDKELNVDETSQSLALLSLARISAHDRENQHYIASPQLIAALEDILSLQADLASASQRQLVGAVIRNLLKHAANRPPIYQMELRLRQRGCTLPPVASAGGKKMAFCGSLAHVPKMSHREKVKASYESWLHDVEQSCTKMGRLAFNRKLQHDKILQKKNTPGKRPASLLTKKLCKPINTLWHSKSQVSLRGNPWSPKAFEASSSDYGLTITVDFDRFFFPDINLIKPPPPPSSPMLPAVDKNEIREQSSEENHNMRSSDHERRRGSTDSFQGENNTSDKFKYHVSDDPAETLTQPAASPLVGITVSSDSGALFDAKVAEKTTTTALRTTVRDEIKRQMLDNFKSQRHSSSNDADTSSLISSASDILGPIRPIDHRNASSKHEMLSPKSPTNQSPRRVKKKNVGTTEESCKSHLAMFAHVDGGRVYKDVPAFYLPDGRKSHVFYQTSYENTDELLLVVVPSPAPQDAPDINEELPLVVNKDCSRILHKCFAFYTKFAQDIAIQQREEDHNPALPPSHSLLYARGCRHAVSGVGWSATGVLFDDALPLLMALPCQQHGSRRSTSFLGMNSGRCERLGTFAYRQIPIAAPEAHQSEHILDIGSSVFADPSMPKSNMCLPACRRVLNDKVPFAKLLARDTDLSPDCVTNIWNSIENRFDIICGLFNYYGCSTGATNSAFTMQLNQFTLFLRDAGFLRHRSETIKNQGHPKLEVETIKCKVKDTLYDIYAIDTSASDTMFIVANKTLPDTMLSKLQEMVKGNRLFQIKRDETLVLYEFIDCLVRLADTTVCQPSSKRASINKAESNRIALDEALEVVLQRIVDLYLHERILLFDVFRIDRMYNWAINSVISENMSMFKKIFNRYICGCGELSRGYGSLPGERMGLVDWMAMVDELGLFNPLFSKREGSWIFVSSTQNVYDPFRNWNKSVSLSFPQFLESICRLADVIFIPNEDELALVGIAPESGDLGFGETDFELAPNGIVGFYRLMQQTTLWNTFERPSYISNAFHLLWEPAVKETETKVQTSVIASESMDSDDNNEEHQQDKDEVNKNSISVTQQKGEDTQWNAESSSDEDSSNSLNSLQELGNKESLETNIPNIEAQGEAPALSSSLSERFYDPRALDYKLIQLIKLILASEARRCSKISKKTEWVKLARKADLDEKKVFKKLLSEQVAIDESFALAEANEKLSRGSMVAPLNQVGRRLTLDIRVAQNLAAKHVPMIGSISENSEPDPGIANAEALASLAAPIKRDLLITAHQACEMVRITAAGRAKMDPALRDILLSKSYVESSSRRLVELRRRRIPNTKRFEALSEVEQQSYMAIVQRAVKEYLGSALS